MKMLSNFTLFIDRVETEPGPNPSPDEASYVKALKCIIFTEMSKNYESRSEVKGQDCRSKVISQNVQRDES